MRTPNMTVLVNGDNPGESDVYQAVRVQRTNGRVYIWEQDNERVVREITTGDVIVMNSSGKTVARFQLDYVAETP